MENERRQMEAAEKLVYKRPPPPSFGNRGRHGAEGDEETQYDVEGEEAREGGDVAKRGTARGDDIEERRRAADMDREDDEEEEEEKTALAPSEGTGESKQADTQEGGIVDGTAKAE